jgi:hypothetical protein
MDCGHQCYIIGGPFIAEDPSCPVHGTQAQQRMAQREARLEELHAILCRIWHRETSADEGLDEIIEMLEI